MPAVSKHLKVLERAGLVTRGREARFRPARLEPKALMCVDAWIESYRRLWNQRLDRLEEYMQGIQAGAALRSRSKSGQDNGR